MKRMLIVLCAVVLAACAQAASVNWKVTGTEAEVGYTAYLIVGDAVTDTWGSVADIAAAAIGTANIAKSGRSYVANGTTTDASLTKDGSFYYVIVSGDGSKYAVSELYSGSAYVYDSAAEPPESAPSTPPTFAASSASYASFGGGSGDVPEPTSGLLLLMGAAGLALRRRAA